MLVLNRYLIEFLVIGKGAKVAVLLGYKQEGEEQGDFVTLI